MRCIITLLLMIFFLSIKAQDFEYLIITSNFKDKPLELNKIYVIKNDTFIITNFKFYISNLQYFKNDSLVYTSTKMAHLIDFTSNESLPIKEEKVFEFDNIKFNIGIDSLTNVSGVFDGDLDPVNGMYWTWQSGYINFKLEGTASHCPARNHKFYWHIGGYLEPFSAMRVIALNCNSDSSDKIVIQLDDLFEAIDVSKTYQVMSPNEKAIQIADFFPKIFKIAYE